MFPRGICYASISLYVMKLTSFPIWSVIIMQARLIGFVYVMKFEFIFMKNHGKIFKKIY